MCNLYRHNFIGRKRQAGDFNVCQVGIVSIPLQIISRFLSEIYMLKIRFRLDISYVTRKNPKTVLQYSTGRRITYDRQCSSCCYANVQWWCLKYGQNYWWVGWVLPSSCKNSLHTHARMYHAPLLVSVTRQWISFVTRRTHGQCHAIPNLAVFCKLFKLFV